MAKLPGALPADPVPYMRLTAALAHMAEGGELPPCAGSPLPTSEDPEDRAEAAHTLCPGCPLLALCAAVGETESFGVWGGRDRDRKRTTRGRRRAA